MTSVCCRFLAGPTGSVMAPLCPRGGAIDERRPEQQESPSEIKTPAADVFHSALFSLHDITSHRSHYQHLTRSSIFTSTNHRRDIHTNIPWVHHSSESASSMCMGLLMKTRGRGHMQEKSCPPVKTQGWCFLLCESVCMRVCVWEKERERARLFNTWRKTSSISLGLSFTESGNQTHKTFSVVSPNKQKKNRKKMAENQDGRHAKQAQPDNQSVNQSMRGGGQESVQASGAQ